MQERLKTAASTMQQVAIWEIKEGGDNITESDHSGGAERGGGWPRPAGSTAASFLRVDSPPSPTVVGGCAVAEPGAGCKGLYRRGCDRHRGGYQSVMPHKITRVPFILLM